MNPGIPNHANYVRRDKNLDVWREEWSREAYASVRSIFKNRLFIEGYPVFNKHIPEGAKTILDVGAGTGRYGVQFAVDFPSATVIITDLLPEALSVIQRVAKERGVTNVVVQEEDTFNLSFPDNHFDVVFCDVVIQHFEDYRRALRELHRVAKPGGTIIISAMNKANFPHTLYKWFARRVGGYKYGYEKSFTRREMRSLYTPAEAMVRDVDGFYFAYGIFRLRSIFAPFDALGRLCNRIVRLVDPWTGRFISRHFGFEIFVVAQKK